LWLIRASGFINIATKANHILGLISKYFEHLDVDSLPILYKTLVLEFANSVWGPHYILDQKMLRENSEESHQTCTIFERIAIC